ncbi:MAG: ATP-grasp domain-containing protein [Methylococcales bacterium]|nr:ATP-grasp domain-containing protein [Methylococcales bacterium]
MKILIFEYICGGGFAGQDLPPSLAAEGRMMLQALLGELKPLRRISLLMPLDKRFMPAAFAENAEIAPVEAGQDVMSLLPELMAQCDAVWPIAPESDGILAAIARMAGSRQKILLASTAQAIALCGDKQATHDCLLAHGLPLVETWPLNDFQPAAGGFVIKPRDGIGCQGGRIVRDVGDWPQRLTDGMGDADYIVQPYYRGQAVSLSCLFKQGRGWLLCCNRQQIRVVDNRFKLEGCLVNVASEHQAFYRQLVNQVAAAMPDLWGYIGIDLLETPDKGPLLLEINPRLTTSYAGIGRATGVNVAEQVLRLLDSEPDLRPKANRIVDIKVYEN